MLILNDKKFYILIGILSLILILLGTFLGFLLFKEKGKTVVNPIAIQEVQPTPPSLPQESGKGIYNILLLGQGAPGHQGGRLTDSINILNIDTNKKTVSLIFLPRDIYATLPQRVNNISAIKINEVYNLGLENSEEENFNLVKQTVGAITGLSINYAILVDFNGFSQIIDSLGGIEINVNKTFDDYYYPIAGKELDNCEMTPEQLVAINATMSGFMLEKQYTCRYEHLHFNAGKTKVDGATALKFARSRHSGQDGSDFARGQRQQIVLIGIKDKLLSLDALKNIDKWFARFIKLVKTNLDLESVKAIASLIFEPKQYKISQIILSEENVLVSSKTSSGQFILIPKAGSGNWTELQQFIKNQLN